MAKKIKVHKYTASEIIELYDNKGSTVAVSELADQFETDYNLFALDPYVAEAGHLSYTSPKAKNDFLKVLFGINKSSLTWQIVTAEDAPEDERKSANDGESLLTGIIEEANRNLSRVGEPTLRDGLAWFSGIRGMVGLKCLIYTNADKETEIDIRPLDPLHMRWERGVLGMVWVGFDYSVSKVEAQERFGIELTGEEDARVIDFFTRNINATVFASGQKGSPTSQFIKEPTPHGLGHVPIWVGFAGGMPTVYNKNNVLQLKHRATSVYNSSRGIYEPFNKQVSFILDTAEKSVAGTLVYQSKDGKKTIKGDPYQNWQVVSIAEGEKIEPLMPARVPPETAMVLSIIDRDKQESTVPYPIGYGVDVGGVHSGTALAMLNDNTRSVYDPFCGLMEQAYQWLCEEILEQFKAKGQKMQLKGFNQDGKFFTFDANPTDIQDSWYVNVKVEPKLPRDEAGELQMALAATQPRANGRPFMSDYTAYEKVIKLANPDAENTRIDDQLTNDMIAKMPQFQIRRIAQALIDKGDREGAEEFLASIPPPQGGGQPQGQPMGQPMGQGGGQQLSPEEVSKLVQIAQQLQAEGKPIPEDIKVALTMAQGQPQ